VGDGKKEIAVEWRAAHRIDQDVSDDVDIDELPEIDRLEQRVPSQHAPWIGRARTHRNPYTSDAATTMRGQRPEPRDIFLYGIYFIDIHFYVAVTFTRFPVWLQDGKWPPEGKLSSSSISRRGFLFYSERSVSLLRPGQQKPCATRRGIFFAFMPPCLPGGD
jgi:hypothetical protein